MTEKYFFGKCGGEDCQFLTNDNICVLDGDCENCPHGKTMEEWAQKLEDNKYFQAIIDDNDVSYAEIAEVMINALLGRGGK